MSGTTTSDDDDAVDDDDTFADANVVVATAGAETGVVASEEAVAGFTETLEDATGCGVGAAGTTAAAVAGTGGAGFCRTADKAVTDTASADADAATVVTIGLFLKHVASPAVDDEGAVSASFASSLG